MWLLKQLTKHLTCIIHGCSMFLLTVSCSTLRDESGQVMEDAMVSQLFGVHSAKKGNNFVRPEGQNVGNFLGDRPSSRVLAAPGGKSNFSLSHEAEQPVAPAQPAPYAQELSDVPEEVPAAPVSAGKLSFLDKMTAKIAGSPAKAPAGGAPVQSVTMMPAAATNMMVRSGIYSLLLTTCCSWIRLLTARCLYDPSSTGFMYLS